MIAGPGNLYFNGLGNLWRSDGTGEGTTSVANLNYVGMGKNAIRSIVLNDKIYFSAYDGIREGLWAFAFVKKRSLLCRLLTITTSCLLAHRRPGSLPLRALGTNHS